MVELVFFFSSRRRHTRFDCDWSSDVCSSDLPLPSLRISFASGSLLFVHETWPQLVNAMRPAPLERSWTECAKPPASAQQERGFGDANAGHVLWLCNRPERRTQFRSDLCAAAISRAA